MHFQKPMLGVPLDWEHPFNKDLALHLAMNEGHGDVVRDLSMNDNHGTLNNMAFPPTAASGWNPGYRGVVPNFDGTDDYIDCGDNPVFNITNGFGVSALIFPTTFGDAHYKSNVVSKEHGDTGFTLRAGLGKPTITVRSDTGAWITSASPVAIPANEIAHIYGGLSGGVLYIYVNGIEKAKTNFPGNPVNNALDLHIGKIPSAASRHFNGFIDQVRIHNRSWTAKEVKDYYINPWQVYLDEEDM